MGENTLASLGLSGCDGLVGARAVARGISSKRDDPK